MAKKAASPARQFNLDWQLRIEELEQDLSSLQESYDELSRQVAFLMSESGSSDATSLVDGRSALPKKPDVAAKKSAARRRSPG